MVGAVAENASLFFAYNRAQQFLKDSGLFYSPISESLSFTGLLVSGGIAGACTSYILTPIELIKCKLQVQNIASSPVRSTPTSLPSNTTSSMLLTPKPILVPAAALHTQAMPKLSHPGPLQLITDIYRAQGISGFWRGQLGTFLRETGGGAAWFGSYEYISSHLKRYHPRNELSSIDAMISGACAGMAFNLVLFPADSIKSRMQTESLSDGQNKGFGEVTRDIWRFGGIKAFYRGCLITVLRAAPSSAVIFWTYENLKKGLH
jgi:mitochondrial ornithine carrier protein